MSEPNSGFDVAVLKEAGLDVSELFGAGAAGGNPFTTAPRPAAAPVQAVPPTPAQAESVATEQPIPPAGLSAHPAIL